MNEDEIKSFKDSIVAYHSVDDTADVFDFNKQWTLYFDGVCMVGEGITYTVTTATKALDEKEKDELKQDLAVVYMAAKIGKITDSLIDTAFSVFNNASINMVNAMLTNPNLSTEQLKKITINIFKWTNGAVMYSLGRRARGLLQAVLNNKKCNEEILIDMFSHGRDSGIYTRIIPLIKSEQAFMVAAECLSVETSDVYHFGLINNKHCPSSILLKIIKYEHYSENIKENTIDRIKKHPNSPYIDLNKHTVKGLF